MTFQSRQEAVDALESARRYLANDLARSRTANDLWLAVADDDEAELLRDAAELRIALREAVVAAVEDQAWVRGVDEYEHQDLAKELTAAAFRSFPEFVLKFEKWYRRVSA
ncbi:hypothetical protein [Tsukamurella paurometabola]|uniref:Uncharacterized protein n=1 Tax=Tsukamurella paurometabola TaxID=2061 RepID=A0A3P8MEL2_TSUPA|nr:hypothetical protein [Tsukamurella paurometabola]UEA83298.1 hypothetical protein LK411_00095 [Tsukamurella paurometabola]VDR40403.1 Uncharacterised protein [Tsukamurella paurometabola]